MEEAEGQEEGLPPPLHWSDRLTLNMKRQAKGRVPTLTIPKWPKENPFLDGNPHALRGFEADVRGHEVHSTRHGVFHGTVTPPHLHGDALEGQPVLQGS